MSARRRYWASRYRRPSSRERMRSFSEIGNAVDDAVGHNVIKLLHTILAASLVIAAHQASSDESRKLPTIGQAVPVDPASDAPRQKAFRDGLRELGWVDG